MTRSFTSRPYVAALVILSFCAPIVAIAAPAVSPDRPTEFRAVAAPPPIVLLARADTRQDHPRRASAVLLISVPLRGGKPNLVRLAAAAKRYAPRCLFTVGLRTGRSPPPIS